MSRMMRMDGVNLLYLILKLFQYILSSVKKIKHSNIEYNHYVNEAQRSLYNSFATLEAPENRVPNA